MKGEAHSVKILDFYAAASGEECIRYQTDIPALACRDSDKDPFVAAGPDMTRAASLQDAVAPAAGDVAAPLPDLAKPGAAQIDQKILSLPPGQEEMQPAMITPPPAAISPVSFSVPKNAGDMPMILTPEPPAPAMLEPGAPVPRRPARTKGVLPPPGSVSLQDDPAMSDILKDSPGTAYPSFFGNAPQGTGRP